MADKISLEQLEGVTSELRDRLNSLNITCVEELVAYHTAVKDDPSTLSDALGISEEKLRKIIDQAEKKLPKELLKELISPLPVDEMNYGSHDPNLLTDE